MTTRPSPDKEPQSRPLLLLGGALVLMAVLMVFSGSESDQQASNSDSSPTIKDLGGGRGGAGAFVPGAPLPMGLQNGAGLPSGPGCSVVEDVRDTLYRLPLNRNDPELYDPPTRTRTPR